MRGRRPVSTTLGSDSDRKAPCQRKSGGTSIVDERRPFLRAASRTVRLALSARSGIFNFDADRCKTSRRKNSYALARGTLRCAREELNLPRETAKHASHYGFCAVLTPADELRGADVGQATAPSWILRCASLVQARPQRLVRRRRVSSPHAAGPTDCLHRRATPAKTPPLASTRPGTIQCSDAPSAKAFHLAARALPDRHASRSPANALTSGRRAGRCR